MTSTSCRSDDSNDDELLLLAALALLWPRFGWQQLGAEAGFISAVRYRPGNSGEIWISGDDGGGLYRSTDGGVSWQLATGMPAGQSTYSIEFSPTDSNRLYAPNHFGRGMLRSLDGGAGWLAGWLAGRPGRTARQPHARSAAL